MFVAACAPDAPKNDNKEIVKRVVCFMVFLSFYFLNYVLYYSINSHQIK